MSEPGRTDGLVRYYCTAGTGMERFLLAEVKEKLAAEDVCQTAGKVLFSSSAGVLRVRELKAAERLFLLLRRDAPVRLPGRGGPAKAAAALRSRVLGDAAQWAGAAATWSRLQGELAGRRPQEGSRGTGGAEAPKRKRDEEEEEEEEERKRRREEDDGGRGSPGLLGRDLHVDRGCRKMEDEHQDEVTPAAGRLPPDPAAPLSFRVSCKCTGALSRCFSSQEVSRVVGGGLSRLLGWKADLKNPQLEVNVSLSDDHFLLGFPLTRLPLANRSYMKTTGLRSTVAWAMASLAQIQPGSCVLDPMCGVGSILIEAAQEHQDACFLGLDIDDGQLQRANENVAFAALQNRIQLLKASSMMLPLPSSSVDAVVCDLPFGRKFGTKTNMAANLPLILTEMERVLCVGGTLVLLLSPQLSCLLKALLSREESGPAPAQEAEPRAGPQGAEPRAGPREAEPGAEPRAGPRGAEPRAGPREAEPRAGPQEAEPRAGPQGAEPRAGPQEAEPRAGPQGAEPWAGPQGAEPRAGPRGAEPRAGPRRSLEHRQTLRVSLGAIDGLIHQYVKTEDQP